MLRVYVKKSMFRLPLQRFFSSIHRDGYIVGKITHQRVCLQNTSLRWREKCNLRLLCTVQPESEKWKTVYEGPISRPVKLVKMLSLTTAVATFIASPVMIFLGKTSASLPVKVALVSMFCFLGGGSTALLHWLTKPYILRMYFDPDQKRFAVETLSLLAFRRRTEFSADDIVLFPDDRAFSTFEANGQKYFIHKELVEAQQVLYFIEERKKEQCEGVQSDS